MSGLTDLYKKNAAPIYGLILQFESKPEKADLLLESIFEQVFLQFSNFQQEIRLVSIVRFAVRHLIETYPAKRNDIIKTLSRKKLN